jgi:hypothetical protein
VREYRHPRNAPGPFYCDSRLCLSCGLPLQEAPDLMTSEVDEDGDKRCYFRRQPETEEELERACRAVEAACCGGVCYGGTDPRVLARLEAELAARRRFLKQLARLRGRWGGLWRALRRALGARPR